MTLNEQKALLRKQLAELTDEVAMLSEEVQRKYPAGTKVKAVSDIWDISSTGSIYRHATVGTVGRIEGYYGSDGCPTVNWNPNGQGYYDCEIGGTNLGSGLPIVTVVEATEKSVILVETPNGQDGPGYW